MIVAQKYGKFNTRKIILKKKCRALSEQTYKPLHFVYLIANALLGKIT